MLLAASKSQQTIEHCSASSTSPSSLWLSDLFENVIPTRGWSLEPVDNQIARHLPESVKQWHSPAAHVPFRSECKWPPWALKTAHERVWWSSKYQRTRINTAGMLKGKGETSLRRSAVACDKLRAFAPASSHSRDESHCCHFRYRLDGFPYHPGDHLFRDPRAGTRSTANR